jgi:amino acid transporter, AAT family
MIEANPQETAQQTSSGSGGTEHGLLRRLRPRQLTMIAIGGAIGVGLFLGSSITIGLAGPGVIVTYVIGAGIALVVAYALAEMAVVHPVAGSFGVYAERYLNPWIGFTVRATYGLAQIIAIGAEVTAVGIYFAFWFPTVPQWLWVVLVSVALVTMNSFQVNLFGETEYWFALIKVVAIVVFILVGILLIIGFSPVPAVGFSNLWAHGGFLPHGWKGVWLALTLVITSYMGLEVVAVAAGEAENPSKTVPQAVRTIVYRLIGFYVLAITVMLCMTPWNQIAGNGQLTGSPFVRAFAIVGVPYADTIMNVVVISAALSSINTDLYLATRMLFSLARGRYLPAWLGNLSPGGVPRKALAASTGGMAVAIILAIYAPSRAFLALYGTAVAGMLYVWIVILATHLRFRKHLPATALAQLPLRLPCHPFPTLVGIAGLAAITATTFFVRGLTYTVPAFGILLGALSLWYLRARHNRTNA